MKARSCERIILHVDGDAFFASCEVALDPKLKGRAVVTGEERGIVSAMSYQAKALGITRGYPIFKLRQEFPSVVVVSSDYFLYRVISDRMFRIVRNHTPIVEEYSIDECFADLTDLPELAEPTPELMRAIGRRIKDDLETKLGMTFSIGIAPTKVLAKIASSSNKPSGLTVLCQKDISDYLSKVPIEKVWGIGASTSIHFWKMGVKKATDLTSKSEAWVREFFDKPQLEIWHELCGISTNPVATPEEVHQEHQKSISKTGTFKPKTNDRTILFSELSRHVEQACDSARRAGLVAAGFSFFLKTEHFRYYRADIKLANAVNTPHDIIQAIRANFEKVYRSDNLFRSTGVTLYGLSMNSHKQADLFNESLKEDSLSLVYKSLDRISKKYGTHSVFLASSFRALDKEERSGHKKRLAIPFMGEVR